jgi:uncharacterized protein (DUF2147 family)
MKSVTIALIFCFMAFGSIGRAQNKADRIAGYYLTYDDETGKEKSQVQIFKASNGKYYGVIVWLKEPLLNGKPKVDAKNPDKQLQNRPVLGLQILKGFSYNEDKDEWRDGSIYNPASGKTYNCYMKFEDGNRLKIRGFIGSSWMGLGKTAYWTKENSERK